MPNNSKVQTLADFYQYGYSSDYSTPKVQTLMEEEGYVLCDKLIYDKYRKLIYDNSYIMKLSLDDEREYRYRPDRLAYNLYSNPNLSHLILYLNNVSEAEFVPKGQIRVINNEALQNVLKVILAHESARTDNIKKKIFG